MTDDGTARDMTDGTDPTDSGTRLTDDDHRRIRGLADAPDWGAHARAIVGYYSDPARAARTPRALIVVHLLGVAHTLARVAPRTTGAPEDTL